MRVGQIKVVIKTGDKIGGGTEGEAYLGIGGREFHLDKDIGSTPFEFKRGSTEEFIIGEGGNIKNKDGYNDLPIEGGDDLNAPLLPFEMIEHCPVYLRLSSDHDWNIDSVNVNVKEYTGNIPLGRCLDYSFDKIVDCKEVSEIEDQPKFNNSMYNFWLSSKDSLFLHLPFIQYGYIGKIKVVIKTGDKIGAGTEGEAYLGIGGREFHLDKDIGSTPFEFKRGSTEEFIIGEGGNIKNEDNIYDLPADLSNKKAANLDFSLLNKKLIYLRFDPQTKNDNWNIDNVIVTVYEYYRPSFPSQRNIIFSALGKFVSKELGNIWVGNNYGLFLFLSEK